MKWTGLLIIFGKPNNPQCLLYATRVDSYTRFTLAFVVCKISKTYINALWDPLHNLFSFLLAHSYHLQTRKFIVDASFSCLVDWVVFGVIKLYIGFDTIYPFMYMLLTFGDSSNEVIWAVGVIKTYMLIPHPPFCLGFVVGPALMQTNLDWDHCCCLCIIKFRGLC